MKTIQMQHQGLTALSRKLKFITVVIAFVVCHIFITGCTFNPSNKYSPKIYANDREVEETFYKNKEEFQQVASLLNESKLFDYLWSKPAIIYTKVSQMKNFFSEKEYDYICDFIEEQGFYEFGQCQDSIYFVFLCENIDVVIYYTKMEADDLSSFLSYISQHSDIKALDDNWYCRCRDSDVTRN